MDSSRPSLKYLTERSCGSNAKFCYNDMISFRNKFRVYKNSSYPRFSNSVLFVTIVSSPIAMTRIIISKIEFRFLHKVLECFHFFLV